MRKSWLSLLLLSACGPTTGERPTPTVAPTPIAPDNTLSSGPGTMPADECPAESKLIYVVDQDGRFSSFRPDTLAFVDLGHLRCPARGGASPFSMAVDRTPTAWVLYDSGEVFKVDVKTVACSASGFPQGQQGFDEFGMGFVSDAAGSSSETLFVGGGSQFDPSRMTAQLGSVDPKTLRIHSVGELKGWPELTGTGDGKLWGFFPNGANPRVSNLDKTTGAEGKVYPLASLDNGGAWAFAHWGGDFWLFLGGGGFGGGGTQVHHLKASDGSLSTPVPNTNRTIVGAGVSTCAPTVIE